MSLPPEGAPPPAQRPGETPPVPVPPVPESKRRFPRRLLVTGGGVAVVAVAAILLVLSLGGRGGKGDASFRAPTASLRPSPLRTVLPPEGLTVTTAPLVVTLHWTEPTGGIPIVGYKVFRDGDLIATVPAPASGYVDETAEPGELYLYSVLARSAGTEQSVVVTIEAEVSAPPSSEARLEGLYSVTAKPTSHTGFEKFSTKPFVLRWQFSPRCDAGPCNTKWLDHDFSDFEKILKRDGRVYRGTDDGKFNVRCGNTTVTTTLELELEVVKAEARSTQWLASKLKGTMAESSDAQLGCTASTATYSVTVELIG